MATKKVRNPDGTDTKLASPQAVDFARREFVTKVATGAVVGAAGLALAANPVLAQATAPRQAAAAPKTVPVRGARLPMTFSCSLDDQYLALMTKEVQPEGIDLHFVDQGDTHAEQEDYVEFDAGELSSEEFYSRLAIKQTPFVAIPVFPLRIWRHHLFVVNSKVIKTPKDLEGKRVGCPRYGMDAAVWLRGLLQHEYGVDLSKIHWVEAGINYRTILPLVQQSPIEFNNTGKPATDLLVEGQVDALMQTALGNLPRRNPDIQRLFPNYHEVEKEYFKKTQIWPIMHVVGIRRDLYEKNPWIAASLFNAIDQSRKIAIARMHNTRVARYMLPWLAADLPEIPEVFGTDNPWVGGITTSFTRKTLDAHIAYLVEQNIIPTSMPVESLFVPIEA